MVKEELSRQVRHSKTLQDRRNSCTFERLWQNDSRWDHLQFQTENYAVVRKYFTLLTKTFNIDTAICYSGKLSDEKRKSIFCRNCRPGTDERLYFRERNFL